MVKVNSLGVTTEKEFPKHSLTNQKASFFQDMKRLYFNIKFT